MNVDEYKFPLSSPAVNALNEELCQQRAIVDLLWRWLKLPEEVQDRVYIAIKYNMSYDDFLKILGVIR